MKLTLKKSLFLALLATSSSLSAQAGTLNFGTTGTGVNGSSTTWDTGVTADWYNGTSAVAWTANSDAVFGGTAGTITVGTGNVSANSLTFNTTGYILNSAGANNAGSITMASGATATVASSVTATINTNFYITGTGGTGAAIPINFTKAGSGTLVLAAVGINGTTPTGTHGDDRPSGQIAITGGTLQMGNGTGWGGYFDNSSFTLSNGSTVVFNYDNNGGSSPNTLANIRGTGNIVLNGWKDGYISEGGSFLFTNTGTTTVAFDASGQSAGNYYFGSVFLQGGGNAFSSTSVLNMVSGNVILRQAQTVAGLTGTGGYITSDSGAQTFTVNTAASTTTSSAVVIGATNFGGSNTENLAITGTGTQVLTGASTYTGTTSITGGSTLQIGANTTSTATGSFRSATTVGSGSTLILDGLANANLNSATTLTGAGNLQVGTGTASFASGFLGLNFGSNSITGTTTINIAGNAAGTGAAWPNGNVFINTPNALSSTSLLNMVNGRIDLRSSSAVTTVAGITGTNSATLISSDASWGGTQNLTDSLTTGTQTYAGAITNTAPSSGATAVLLSFTKTGAGTQILTGATSYTGATSVSVGTLQLGAATDTTTSAINTFNSAVTIASGATFVLDGGSVTATLGSGVSLTGAGNLQIGNGSTSFAGSLLGLNEASNNITGTTTINIKSGATWPNGEVFIGANSLSASSLLSMVSGSIDLRASTAVAGISGTNTAAQISSDQGVVTAADVITDNVATGSVSYAGKILNLAPGSNIGGAGLSTVGLTKTGTGTQVLTGAVSYTGATAVNVGTLQLGATTDTTSSAINTFASAVTIASGATLVMDGGSASSTLGNGTTLTGAGNLQIGTGTSSFTGAFTGLNEASNNITGTTTINVGSGAWPAGAVFINNSNSLSSSSLLNMVNGKLDFRSNASVAGITGTNTATLLASDGFAAYTPTLTDNVATGTQTYAGGIANTISGSGGAAAIMSFTKTGAGTQTLSGTNTYSGATTISAGTLNITGSIANSAVSVGNLATLSGTGATGAVTLASGGAVNLSTDGAIGTLTVGGLTTTGGGSMSFEIGGVTTSVDKIADTGSLSIGGVTTINIANLGGVGQSLTNANNTYALLTFGSGTASLSNFNLATTSLDSKGLSLSLSGNTLYLNVGPAVTSTSYTVVTTAGSTVLHQLATTSLNTVITNTGTGTADTLNYTGLGASSSQGNGIAAGATSGGPVANTGGTASNGQTYTATTAGTDTISANASGTNATLGGAASGTPTGTTITVYTGQGTWTGANSTGSWGAVSATPANWTAIGGTPGLDAGFTGVDTATFGAVSGGTTPTTVSLNGANPNLNAINFTTATRSYTLAQGSGGSITLSGTTPAINVTAGSHTISAPVILGANTSLATSSGTQLEISGAVSGSSSLTKTGSGTAILSNSAGNTYTNGTTVSGGKLYVTNTTGSGTGTGAVAVTGSGSQLGGNGKIGGVVTLSSGGSLYSGGVVTGTPTTGSGSGMTLSSALNVNGGNLTFALSNGGSGGTVANPLTTSTYLTLSGGAVINFTGTDSITLVDLSNGGLSLRENNAYLLVSASSNAAYSGLVTRSSSGVISLDGNGLVLGVYTGSGEIATNYTVISFNQLGSDGVTPLNNIAGVDQTYLTPQLYLNNGQLELVPEPGTWALMIGGLGVLVMSMRVRRKV